MLVFLYPFLRPYKRLFLDVWVTDCILCYCAHYKIALNVISCDLCIVILFHNVIYLFCRIYFMVYLLFSFAVNFFILKFGFFYNIIISTNIMLNWSISYSHSSCVAPFVTHSFSNRITERLATLC